MAKSKFVAKSRNRAGADVVVVITDENRCEAHCKGCTQSDDHAAAYKNKVIAWAQKHADSCSFGA